jgi:hypothetical protein
MNGFCLKTTTHPVKHNLLMVLGILFASHNVSHATPGEGGAFANSLMNEETVCFSKSDLDDMQPDIWLEQMKKRSKDCRITDSEPPLPSSTRWKAHCTDMHGTTHDYEFSVSLPGEQFDRLIISSKITNEAGKLALKKGFMGEYKGNCQSDMKPFAIWDYFDLPDHRVMESVVRDLLYCGAIFTGISTKLKAPKGISVLEIGQSLTASAAYVLPHDPEFIQQEMKSAADRAASEIAGADNEEMLQLIQSPKCQPYLESKGSTAVISERNAALSVDGLDR